MVQPAFDIGELPVEDIPAGARLLLEVSDKSLNYILYTREPQQLLLLRQYRMYTSADRSVRDLLEEIISEDPVLEHYGGQATVVYNFPGSMLVPEQHYAPELNQALTRVGFGDTSADFVFHEPVAGAAIRNVYSVARDIHSLVKQKFSGSRYIHFYTTLLLWSQQPGEHTGSLVRVVFYNDKFVAGFFRQGQLHLVQTFTYQTPEDVAYYLLMIGRQFGIPQQDMYLYVSGLIDSQSALYAELLKYFPQVHNEGIPESYDLKGLLNDYPAHYFSPLLNISLCV